jgi:hypothetical protein
MRCFARLPARRRRAVWWLPVLMLCTGHIARAEDPQPSPAKGLPTLAAGETNESVRLQGEIRHSTRGRGRGRGAVRLDVVSDAGEKVAVLTVSNDTLDALGLSLRPGERIDARGSLLQGKVPLLVAVELVVDGRTVRLRETPGESAKGAAGEKEGAPGAAGSTP